jgi:hypothetical protein
MSGDCIVPHCGPAKRTACYTDSKPWQASVHTGSSRSNRRRRREVTDKMAPAATDLEDELLSSGMLQGVSLYMEGEQSGHPLSTTTLNLCLVAVCPRWSKCPNAIIRCYSRPNPEYSKRFPTFSKNFRNIYQQFSQNCPGSYRKYSRFQWEIFQQALCGISQNFPIFFQLKAASIPT